MASFSEMRGPTFKIYVAEQGMPLPNWLKTFQVFWLHSPGFSIEKRTEELNFHSFFLAPRNLLVASFNEMYALTSKKHLVEQGLPTQIWSKTFPTFWLHSPNFALEKQLEKLNFKSFCTFKKHFDG